MAPVIHADGPLDPSCRALQPYRQSLRLRGRRTGTHPPSTADVAPMPLRIPPAHPERLDPSASIRRWRIAGLVVSVRGQPSPRTPAMVPPNSSGAKCPTRRGAIPANSLLVAASCIRNRPRPLPGASARPVSGPPDTGNGRVLTPSSELAEPANLSTPRRPTERRPLCEPCPSRF